MSFLSKTDKREVERSETKTSLDAFVTKKSLRAQSIRKFSNIEQLRHFFFLLKVGRTAQSNKNNTKIAHFLCLQLKELIVVHEFLKAN
jgi:hypothetical protein